MVKRSEVIVFFRVSSEQRIQLRYLENFVFRTRLRHIVKVGFIDILTTLV